MRFSLYFSKELWYDKMVKLYASRIGSSNKNGEIGEIIHIYEDGIGIRTEDGEIIITELQFEGKKETLAKRDIERDMQRQIKRYS